MPSNTTFSLGIDISLRPCTSSISCISSSRRSNLSQFCCHNYMMCAFEVQNTLLFFNKMLLLLLFIDFCVIGRILGLYLQIMSQTAMKIWSHTFILWHIIKNPRHKVISRVYIPFIIRFIEIYTLSSLRTFLKTHFIIAH